MTSQWSYNDANEQETHHLQFFDRKRYKRSEEKSKTEMLQFIQQTCRFGEVGVWDCTSQNSPRSHGS